MSRLLLWKPWLEQSRYDRFQRLALVKPNANTVLLRSVDQAAGGVNRPFERESYVVLVGGQEHITISPPAGSSSFAVPFDLLRLTEGWHWIDIRADGDESPVPFPLYVQHGAKPVPQPFIPVIVGSHTVATTRVAQWVDIPSKYKPTSVPLPAREYPISDAPITRASIVQTSISPWRNGDLYRPMDIGGGCLWGFSRQWYFFSSLTSPRPNLPSLDGPRGVGCVGMATHLQVGRNGGIYFTDPWRVGHISTDGTVKTLVGWRHKHPVKYEAMADDALELVGDWSAVPEGRRSFHELWGMAWDKRTLAVGGEPIPNGANGPEQPHISGPVMFVSDSQNNRVCRIEFDPRSHDTPAKVSEFITGIRDPWDVVCVDGVLYVSERQAHRIAAYDATTGAFIRTLTSGPALTFSSNRKMVRSVSLEQIRQHPCVAPEGLYHLDGWIYFGSLAQGQVRKVNILTGDVAVVCDLVPTSSEEYVKIAVSDGTFGPRGMVAVTSWNVTNWGRPALYTPDGKPIGWINTNGQGQGPGACFEQLGYSGAVGIGLGRMLCSSAGEGVTQFSRALPSDKFISSADWRAARKQYAEAGYDLTHGNGGWGFYGLPLPWGSSPQLDQYLTANGHTRN